jgi:hypothetical protein
MSQSFSNLIKVNGRLHEFNFRRIPGKDLKYHVDVPDNRGNRIIFHITREDEGWKSSGELPDWVRQAESAIVEVIEQQDEDRQKNLTRKRSEH